MEVVKLERPFYEFKDIDDPQALEHLALVTKVFNALHDGTLYCRYIDGDRKGSIAKVSPQDERTVVDRYGREIDTAPKIERHRGRYHNDSPYYTFENDYFSVFCTWDGRRNKIKEFFHDSITVEFLLDYDGPTVWQKFDSKAAKEEVLKNPDQRDIDGNVLKIDDRVLYINARYGSAMVLERGTIKEFKAVVDSKSTTITTIIESDKGEQSSLKHPSTMVCKL